MSKDTIHRIRPHKCACGSTWFREESFVELPKKHWEYDPEDSVNNAPNPIRLLVCVCGRPVAHVPKGVHGRTATAMPNSLKRSEGRSNAHALDVFRQQAAVKRAQFRELQERVQKLKLCRGADADQTAVGCRQA